MRPRTSRVGIETIAVELSSERAEFGYTMDALEEAVRDGNGVDLTDQAVALLRRLEKLVSEAGSNMARFSGRSPLPALGMAQATPTASGDLLIPTTIFFGIVAVGLIVVLLVPKD